METGYGSIAITMESVQALLEVTDLLQSGAAPTRAGLVQVAAQVTRVHNMLEALNLQLADEYRDLVTEDLATPDPDGRRAPVTGQRLIDESRRVAGQDLSPAWHLSPASARSRVGLARAAAEFLPTCLDRVRQGEATEDHLTAVMRASVVLEPGDQARMDHDLAPHLPMMTVRQTTAAAFKRACELDAATMVERAERAAKDAHVSMRPAPDCMTRLSALLPVKDGVAIDVALTRHAQAAKASGDPRSLGQLKAALLVAWVRDGATRAEHDHTVWASDHTTWTDTDGTVGPGPTADSAATSSDGAGAHGSPLAPALGRYRPADGICQHGPRVEVQVTITDLALLGFTTTPAYVAGYGTVPAGVARQIIRDATEQERSALRRLWTNPGDGTLTQMEAKSRLFPKGLARFIRARDQVCTTEYCGAPIRQIDHIHAYAAGGPTTANNGQGLCTACNQAKEHTDIRPDHLQDYPTKPWNRCSSTA